MPKNFASFTIETPSMIMMLQSSEHVSPDEQRQFPYYYHPHNTAVNYSTADGSPLQYGNATTAFAPYNRYNYSDQHQSAQEEVFSPVYGHTYPLYYPVGLDHTTRWIQQSPQTQYSGQSPVADYHLYTVSSILGRKLCCTD